MDDTEATSLEQIRAFLAGSDPMQFSGQRREEVYGWVEKTLVRRSFRNILDLGLVRARATEGSGSTPLAAKTAGATVRCLALQ